MESNKNKEGEDCCPECGNSDNLHFNYDYASPHLAVVNILCNECGAFFDLKQPVEEYEYDKLGNLHKKTG